MRKKQGVGESKTLYDLEAVMQKVSLVVSLVALSLMGGGYSYLLVQETAWSLPGESVLSWPAFLDFAHAQWSLEVMSAGIILLSLLPSVRVFLVLWLFIRRRSIVDILVTVIVLAELLLSMRAGG